MQTKAKAKSEEEPNPVGRPPLFETPEDMEPLIKDYFKSCDEEKRPYTIPGLALALGFEERHAIARYESKKKFRSTIKKARLVIEQQRVEQLLTSPNVAGKIFDLKNNFDYRDQREITGKDGAPLHPATEAPMTVKDAVGLINQMNDRSGEKE